MTQAQIKNKIAALEREAEKLREQLAENSLLPSDVTKTLVRELRNLIAKYDRPDEYSVSAPQTFEGSIEFIDDEASVCIENVDDPEDVLYEMRDDESALKKNMPALHKRLINARKEYAAFCKKVKTLCKKHKADYTNSIEEIWAGI